MQNVPLGPTDCILFTGNQARKLRQLRAEAPADHHRYLLWLTIYCIEGGFRAEDVIPMYEEEFDVHTSPEPIHPG